MKSALRHKLEKLKVRIHKKFISLFLKFRGLIYIIRYNRFCAKRKIAHITFYSASNVGDTVLSTCVRDLFDKASEKNSWKLISLLKPINENYIKKLNKSSVIVLGGHGAFMPDTNENQLSGWEWACSIEQYREISTPIIVFAVGYNYFAGQARGKLFEENIQNLVEKSAFFGLRNRGSVREIQSFMNDSLKDKVVYQPCPTMIARKLYPTLPSKVTTGKIAFNVALDRADMRMGESKTVILNEIAQAMKELSLRGYEIHFIAHGNIEIAFVKYLKKHEVKYQLQRASLWDASKLMMFYNDMDVVVGMRGHGIWVPYGVNCHIISLGNQNKTKWFLEDINALDWHIDIRNNPETLCEQIINKFEDIHEVNGDLTTERLIQSQNDLYQITIQNMEIIKKIIK